MVALELALGIGEPGPIEHILELGCAPIGVGGCRSHHKGHDHYQA
jgi:hypothetical protein